MARKKVTRSLPLLPAVPSFGKRDNKTDQLLAILRTVAVENRKEHRQPFYSLRDIAAHFHIQLSTVSRIYRQLEQEGYLSRVRGSRTLLQGSNFDRHLSVRAFVGLPVSLSAFVTQQDYRMFFIRLRRELRLRGFATEMILLGSHELQSPSFTEQLKAYEIETVVWFRPSKEMRQTALRLADAGIRMVGLSEEPSPHIPCRYQLRRESALRSLLNQWKTQSEVAKITVVQSPQHRAQGLEEILHTLLDQHGMRSATATFSTQATRAFVRSLLRSKTGGILFPSASLASLFSFQAPKALTALMQTHRVGLISGPVSMPFSRVPEVRVDLITFDWQVIAETIVDDLVTQEAFRDRGPVVFEAEPHVRVPLNRFAQEI